MNASLMSRMDACAHVHTRVHTYTHVCTRTHTCAHVHTRGDQDTGVCIGAYLGISRAAVCVIHTHSLSHSRATIHIHSLFHMHRYTHTPVHTPTCVCASNAVIVNTLSLSLNTHHTHPALFHIATLSHPTAIKHTLALSYYQEKRVQAPVRHFE